jgi:putative ABC transport system ATP-binding protein
MLDMNREYKTTFIFSTHDQRVVEKARRIVTIDDGKVTEDKKIA